MDICGPFSSSTGRMPSAFVSSIKFVFSSPVSGILSTVCTRPKFWASAGIQRANAAASVCRKRFSRFPLVGTARCGGKPGERPVVLILAGLTLGNIRGGLDSLDLCFPWFFVDLVSESSNTGFKMIIYDLLHYRNLCSLPGWLLSLGRLSSQFMDFHRFGDPR